jgi:hypothetical protein
MMSAVAATPRETAAAGGARLGPQAGGGRRDFMRGALVFCDGCAGPAPSFMNRGLRPLSPFLQGEDGLGAGDWRDRRRARVASGALDGGGALLTQAPHRPSPR